MYSKECFLESLMCCHVLLQYFVLSGVLAMVTCAVFLRLSCLLKLVVLLMVIAVYTYLIEVALHVLFIRQHHNGQLQRYYTPPYTLKRPSHSMFWLQLLHM